jgi:tetratricopeptide (TPR) repeat protein
MAEDRLPLPASAHVALARALDWVWPGGAAWAHADALAHAPRDPELVATRRRAWRKTHGARRLAALLLAASPSLPSLSRAAPPEAPARAETPAAREQARLCERENLEAGVAACRAALELGIGPERRKPVRELLAKHLVSLERWDELAELFRENVRLEPQSAEAWQRLGQTLLFALDQREEAVAALEEAARLAPADAPTRVALALALHASGRPKEAVSAFEEALRLDADVLEGRPATRAVLDAARRGEPWPGAAALGGER